MTFFIQAASFIRMVLEFRAAYEAAGGKFKNIDEILEDLRE